MEFYFYHPAKLRKTEEGAMFTKIYFKKITIEETDFFTAFN